MEWTKEKPTKVGYYWHRYDGKEPNLAEVYVDCFGSLCVRWMGSDCDTNVSNCNGEWSAADVGL